MWHGVVERGPVHALAFTPDSRTLLSIDGTSTLISWDLATQTPQQLFKHTHTRYHSRMTLSLDGNSVLVGEGLPERGRYWCWDRQLNRLVYPGDTSKDPGGAFWFLSQGVSWPSFSIENRVYLCEVTTSRLSYFKWPPKGESSSFNLPATYRNHTIRRMLSDASGLRLAIWFTDETVLIWDRTGSKQQRQVQQVASSEVPVMTFSPDSQFLALGTISGITVIASITGEVVSTIELPGRKATELAIHPNNKYLAVADGRAIVSFWDLNSGCLIRDYGWKIGLVRSLAFSPDGLLCAAGGTQKKFVIWDVD